jgi:hypothetical protein
MESDSKPNKVPQQISKPQSPEQAAGPECQSSRSASPIAHSPANTPDSKDGKNSGTPFWEKAAVVIALALLIVNICQTRATQKAADAARDSAKISGNYLTASQRPWIKIKHRIVRPLTFNFPTGQGLIADMVVEDTIENVGTSVALNVISWEDVLPVDSDFSLHTALARQDAWCNANRHPDPKSLSGYILFPKDPFSQKSEMGPSMDSVNKMTEEIPVGTIALKGKVAFVMVGCVCYRSPVESESAALHETKFVYRLGELQSNGTVRTYVVPDGIANNLDLIKAPEGFSAD